MTKQRTTSIVDISEIESDDELLQQQQQQQQQQQHHHHQPFANNSSKSAAAATTTTTVRPTQLLAPTAAAAAEQTTILNNSTSAAHLYLYHEDSQPQQRISSVLSNICSLQPPPSGQGQSRSADTSPGQTLARPLSTSALPALADYSAANNELISLNQINSSSNSNQKSSHLEPPVLPPTSRHLDGASTPNGGDQQQQEQPADQQQPSKANLNTLFGVYFPCVQNIFGVILFIRMVWIVGTAGVPAAFAIVFICCCVTLTTSISLSAIATNGIVPAGGSYFMISRSLGPECGGAVGTMFFLGTTVAGAMYITGAVEIMLNYLCPSIGLFGDFQRDVNIMYHNIRVYGTLLLIVVGIFVWIGVRFVSKLAPIALACVLISILSIYVGIFVHPYGRDDIKICVLGERLVTLKNLPWDKQAQMQQMNISQQQIDLMRTEELCQYDKLKYVFCPPTRLLNSHRSNNNNNRQHHQNKQTRARIQTNNEQGDHNGDQPAAGQDEHPAPAMDEKEAMRELFSQQPNLANCDPYFEANKHLIRTEFAVPGIASGVIMQNLKPRFRQKGTIVSYDDGINTSASGFNFIFVDISTSFTALIAIYFPSCTGILAGSNRSGDLADAQRSIPRGTISAQLTTSFVYLSCIILFGCTFNNLYIRDKFGESMGGQLAVTQIAFPVPFLILIGGLLSTLGASLQSLVGAPRILQGIAKDDVIPCFHRFAKLSARGEPETAIVFTLIIAEMAVLIGNLDFIAPILTLSLVMCYFFINLACAMHSLLGSPNWRPRFRHYHWSISILGCLLCLFVMIVSSLTYFMIAVVLAGCIYKYIEFSGAEKEWGDGKQGLALSTATFNLMRLKPGEQHTKNWRPQLLLFAKLKPSGELDPPFVKANRVRQQRLQQQLAGGGGGALLVGASAESSGAVIQLPPTIYEQGAPGAPAATSAGVAPNELVLAHPKLLTFASQLKAGKGLTLISSVLEGDYQQLAPVAKQAKAHLQNWVQRERVRGFADVLVSSSILDGLSYQVQAAGLGGLKHNTIILGWPTNWRRPVVPSKPASAIVSSTSANIYSRLPGPKRASLKQQRAAAAAAAAEAAGSSSSTPAHQSSQPGAAAAASGQAKDASAGNLEQPTATAGFDSTSAAAAGAGATTAGSPMQHQTRAHLFIELMRNVQVSQNALLVVKGVDSWPESCDKLGGYIDIWWIVNEGGLLMLLPHLLRQHRTWKGCQLRVFTVAQANDNPEQMRQDLTKFLYHLRIEAKVDIVEMKDTEISDYAYERTLMMEQRSEIMKRLNVTRRQSVLLEQEVDGRLIRFRIRKPSTCDFEETIPFVCSPSSTSEQLPSLASNNEQQQQSATATTTTTGQSNQQTTTNQHSAGTTAPANEPTTSSGGGAAGHAHANPLLQSLRPDEANVRRMHTALSLNEAILKRSKSAKLVIINLPGAPKEATPEAENNYMEFVEIITDKLERVLLVQNSGREVITIHS